MILVGIILLNKNFLYIERITMVDAWGYDNELTQCDSMFAELEYHPEKILIEQYRNILYDLLKDGDNNDYRIDFIRYINDFTELNDNSHVQQQAVIIAILYDSNNKEWLDRLGQYVDGQLVPGTNWDETPGYHELETDDNALTTFRQQLYKLLS